MVHGSADEERWREMNEAIRRSETLSVAGQHAAAIMHDINNPLEAALNLAYLIGEEAEDAGKVRAYSQVLYEQLSSVTAIARQTLSFYKTPMAMKDVDLVEVARAALRVHEYKMTSRGLCVAQQLPEKALVVGHSGELLQVLTNLLANALDALPEKGEMTLRIRKSRDEVHVTLADNGCGIADHNLARIFEPFFTTKQERGTGLGLAISKSIVERHRGKMRARSSVRSGRSGTAFRISLPLALTAAARD